MGNSRPRLGLCSVTYRALPAEEVLRLSAAAGLECIEWGADVHAPPSDALALAHVRDLTRDTGLVVASYGAYWRAGVHPVRDLEPVLELLWLMRVGLALHEDRERRNTESGLNLEAGPRGGDKR